ncbi:MAG: hypothetical protein K5751_05215 [Treponemataceae bacterium]|nr:hypothetical protein [Treponemataceae bacterium]
MSSEFAFMNRVCACFQVVVVSEKHIMLTNRFAKSYINPISGMVAIIVFYGRISENDIVKISKMSF